MIKTKKQIQKLKVQSDIVLKYDCTQDSNKRKYYDISIALDACLQLAKDMKFNPSLELAVSLNIDTRQSDQNVRFSTNMKHETGKTPKRIAVISNKQEDIDLAKSLNVHMAGGQDIIDEIKAGNINFDLIITTPQSIPLLAPVTRILGAKRLMPTPKSGRITTNIAEAIKQSSTQIEVRTDKIGIFRSGIGKVSIGKEKLLDNVLHLIKDISNARPSGAKGKFIKSIFISYTQGPGFRINLSSVEV